MLKIKSKVKADQVKVSAPEKNKSDDALPVSPSFEFGVRGKDVTKLQESLNRWGYLGNTRISGEFCAHTRDAVMAFQGGQALPATGIVDGKTAKVLKG